MATRRKPIPFGGGGSGLARRKTVTDFDSDAFLAGLDDTVRKLKIRSEEELEELGEDAVEMIREDAPADRGELRDSVKSESGKDSSGAYVDISVQPYYSSFLEWGTRYMRAQPFFRPGLEKAIAQFPSRFRRLLGR